MKSKSFLSRKVQVELGFAILVLLAMAAISYRAMVASTESDLWVRHTHETIEKLQDLLLEIESVESSYRGFALTGKESYLAPYRGSRSGAERDEAALRDLTVDNSEQQRRLTVLDKKVAEKIEFAETVIRVRRGQGFAAASRLLDQDEGLRLMNEIRAVAAGMDTEERDLLEVRTSRYQASARNSKWVIRLGWLMSLGFLIAATMIVRHDFTKLRRAGDVTQAQAELLNLVHDAILVRNPADEITFWNDGAAGTYGWAREEALGRDPNALLHTHFPRPLLEIKAELAERGVWEGELTHVCKSGRQIVVESRWVLNRDIAGRLTGTLEINRDITDRKGVEETLARLAAIVESSNDAILSESLDGTIQSWNQGAERLYGYAAKETMGQSIALLAPLGDGDDTRDILGKIVRGEQVEHYEIQRVRKDGQRIDVSLTISPIKDSTGTLVGASTIGRDITDQKRAEAEVKALNGTLRERMADLEAANRELEAFTYSVSHDLRAPLRHVDGFSKLLVEEHQAELSPGALEYVAIIRDSVLQMGMLIDDLLNLTRVGRTPLSMQVTGLSSLVEEVRADLARANPDRLIEWKVETLPFVECDPALMKQVFVNLLSNAVKFTRPRKSAVIEVGTVIQDGHPVVFVRDNGVGFSMKYVNKLFGVFQRLHRAEDFEGTGVGLATVQRIIRKHGGRVWAEAALDKGATFYFTLGSGDDPQAESPTNSGGKI